MAIEMLLTGLSPNKDGIKYIDAAADDQKIACLIGGLKFQYPKGLNSVSLVDQDMLYLFVDLVTKADTMKKHEFWLQHNEHYDWLKMLLEQVESKKNKCIKNG